MTPLEIQKLWVRPCRGRPGAMKSANIVPAPRADRLSVLQALHAQPVAGRRENLYYARSGARWQVHRAGGESSHRRPSA
jgi:hypothetical protein